MQDQNSLGQAGQPTQSVTVNNASQKSSKGAVVALTAILALLVGCGGTFAAMKLIDNGESKTNCSDSSKSGDNNSANPNGAQNAEDQKYAEDRNAFEALRTYIDFDYDIVGGILYPMHLFPGSTSEEISSEQVGDNLVITNKYSGIAYDDFMTRAKASYAESVIKTNPTLEDDWFTYENCDGSVCVKYYGGLGGIIPKHYVNIVEFTKVSDGVYEQVVHQEDYVDGAGLEKVYTYRATFDASGVMTNITKTEK
ncbi:MAG: hypothetical protein Q4A96_03860 [Candidatus Saccharibacteria bacterium]|nr:hypothetical protein [Candidatus Saccharibacteria bacterium]